MLLQVRITDAIRAFVAGRLAGKPAEYGMVVTEPGGDVLPVEGTATTTPATVAFAVKRFDMISNDGDVALTLVITTPFGTTRTLTVLAGEVIENKLWSATSFTVAAAAGTCAYRIWGGV